MAEREMAATISIEVAYADPQLQILRKVEIAANSTVDQAIAVSGIMTDLPGSFESASIGIFGRIVNGDTRLHAGDRIELYRPLIADPKETRRKRAGALKKRAPAP
jgi:uncharacterized protein